MAPLSILYIDSRETSFLENLFQNLSDINLYLTTSMEEGEKLLKDHKFDLIILSFVPIQSWLKITRKFNGNQPVVILFEDEPTYCSQACKYSFAYLIKNSVTVEDLKTLLVQIQTKEFFPRRIKKSKDEKIQETSLKFSKKAI